MSWAWAKWVARAPPNKKGRIGFIRKNIVRQKMTSTRNDSQKEYFLALMRRVKKKISA
jgi:hypothetical protein